MSRLEEIKIAYGYDTRLNKDTYPSWLINHIEELQAKVDELEERNNFLERAHKTNIKIAEYAKEENQRYKQALEFYADRFKYHEMLDQSGVLTVIEDDCGFIARQTLEESE